MNELNSYNILTLAKQIILPIEERNYKGWDLFDGLNSRIFKRTFLYKSRILRLIWIQFFKKSPVNFRKIAKIPKGHNAKGLSLFIKGYINIFQLEKKDEYLQKAYKLADIIISQGAKDRSYFCVGYNFHWEARAFTVPAFTPNMIVSSFVGQSFLDLYDIDKNSKWLNLVIDIAYFIEKELLVYHTDNEVCYGYIPNESVRVHNANLMGARLLARLFTITKEEKYKYFAEKSVNYSINAQRRDGAWEYGEENHHKWIDNFHTGFNLVAIKEVQQYLQINVWNENIKRGLDFHLKYHFLDDMTPKYFNNKLYPIDIHNFAQGIDTLCVFGNTMNAKKMLDNSMMYMFDNQKKYFFYQKSKLYTNRSNYIRWAQSWMFYAITKYALTISINE
jgi:hypothetical protein